MLKRKNQHILIIKKNSKHWGKRRNNLKILLRIPWFFSDCISLIAKGMKQHCQLEQKLQNPSLNGNPGLPGFIPVSIESVHCAWVWPWCSFLLLVQILYIWLFTRLKYMFICFAHAHGCSASCKLSFIPRLPLTPVEILHSTFECCETFISNASFHHNRLLFYNIYLE